MMTNSDQDHPDSLYYTAWDYWYNTVINEGELIEWGRCRSIISHENKSVIVPSRKFILRDNIQ